MRRSLVVGLVVTLIFAGTNIVFTASADSDRTCSNNSIQGQYAYSADGVVTGTPGQPPFTPIAEAGTYTFDGEGGFSTKNTISVGGRIIPRSATGTYTVNADCTGSASITGGAAFDFAITRADKSFRFVVTTAGVAVTGIMERQ